VEAILTADQDRSEISDDADQDRSDISDDTDQDHPEAFDDTDQDRSEAFDNADQDRSEILDKAYRTSIKSEIRAIMEGVGSFSASTRPARWYGVVPVEQQHTEAPEYLKRFESDGLVGLGDGFEIVSFISVGETLYSFSLDVSHRPN